MVELKISEIISRERKRLNLTQEELAKALYVSPQLYQIGKEVAIPI